MGDGFTVGRLFGIRINIDWSWLLILLLVIWNLSAGFATIHPEWAAAMRWGIALISALLFFASVLAHEMAHSLMARAQGVPVRTITLFLFGGVSNIEREPPSPQAEFAITIVGPITSVLLGVLFSAVGIFLAPSAADLTLADPAALAAQLSPTATVMLWLGPINFFLGLFNLIPGFPLDGGRLLRSTIWAITDDLRLATKWATRMGQFFAWLLIIGGIGMVFGVTLPFFGTGISGLWLVFIGWFLNTAAIQSYRRVVVRDMLEGVPVARLMRRDPPAVAGESSVDTLVHGSMMETDEHAFPVMEDGEMRGLVTLEDVRRVPRDKWDTVRVDEMMTPAAELTTVSAEKDAADAFSRLQKRDVRQMPVVENGRLIGLLRRRDILKWLQLQEAD